MKTAFKGKLLKVYVKKERLPHGYVATYEMIKHPGASLVVPFLDKDTVIMLRQLRPVVGRTIYEFPAGTLDRGESPLSCARREIVEETGYRANRFRLLGAIYPVPGYSTEKIFMYKAEGLKEVERTPEEDEVIEHGPFTKIQVRKLFRQGRIVDAKTICGLAMIGWV